MSSSSTSSSTSSNAPILPPRPKSDSEIVKEYIFNNIYIPETDTTENMKDPNFNEKVNEILKKDKIKDNTMIDDMQILGIPLELEDTIDNTDIIYAATDKKVIEIYIVNILTYISIILKTFILYLPKLNNIYSWWIKKICEYKRMRNQGWIWWQYYTC